MLLEIVGDLRNIHEDITLERHSPYLQAITRRGSALRALISLCCSSATLAGGALLLK
jgi:hypothetical protein